MYDVEASYRSHMHTFRILLLCCLAHHGQAQQTAWQPRIEVTGEAEMQVEPNEIHLRITLMERGTGSNKVTVESQEQWLKRAVKDLGLDTTALTLSGAMADLVPRNFRSDDVIARKRYLLRVTDAETVRKVFLELDRLQIHDAGIQRVAHSKEAEFRREMRIKAITAAKQKADDLLAAVGEHTGPALEVSDLPVAFTPRTQGGLDQVFGGRSMNVKRLIPEPNTYQELGVGFSSITIKAEVYCAFAIAAR